MSVISGGFAFSIPGAKQISAVGIRVNARGEWEKEISVRASTTFDGPLEFQWNSSDEGKRPGAMVRYQQLTTYTVECHFKRYRWNPSASWNPALAYKEWQEVDGPGYRWVCYGWWTGEDGTAQPGPQEPNGRFQDLVMRTPWSFPL